jgi:hypothetical protein
MRPSVRHMAAVPRSASRRETCANSRRSCVESANGWRHQCLNVTTASAALPLTYFADALVQFPLLQSRQLLQPLACAPFIRSPRAIEPRQPMRNHLQHRTRFRSALHLPSFWNVTTGAVHGRSLHNEFGPKSNATADDSAYQKSGHIFSKAAISHIARRGFAERTGSLPLAKTNATLKHRSLPENTEPHRAVVDWRFRQRKTAGTTSNRHNAANPPKPFNGSSHAHLRSGHRKPRLR